MITRIKGITENSVSLITLVCFMKEGRELSYDKTITSGPSMG